MQALAEAEALRGQQVSAAGDLNDLQFSLDQQQARAAAEVGGSAMVGPIDF